MVKERDGQLLLEAWNPVLGTGALVLGEGNYVVGTRTLACGLMRPGLGKRLKNQGNISYKWQHNHAVGKDRHTLATHLIWLSVRVKTVECGFCDVIKSFCGSDAFPVVMIRFT